MTSLRFPLDRNVIRQNKTNNAFGMVRNGGHKAHQGWDLLATPLTNCYAVADGMIRTVGSQRDYGKVVALEFEHKGRKLYAFYAHLSIALVIEGEPVVGGQVIALTGKSGNASNLSGDDLHLHFEIRTVLSHPGVGLIGRIDPALLYGATPTTGPLFSAQSARSDIHGGAGLKVTSGF